MLTVSDLINIQYIPEIIEIIDKETSTVLEIVDRAAAINKADEEINKIATNWIKEEFPKLRREYEDTTLHKSHNSRKKKEWVSKLIKHLESNKQEIHEQVRVFDPYWTAKIVSEQTKKYKKECAMEIIENALTQK